MCLCFAGDCVFDLDREHCLLLDDMAIVTPLLRLTLSFSVGTFIGFMASRFLAQDSLSISTLKLLPLASGNASSE